MTVRPWSTDDWSFIESGFESIRCGFRVRFDVSNTHGFLQSACRCNAAQVEQLLGYINIRVYGRIWSE